MANKVKAKQTKNEPAPKVMRDDTVANRNLLLIKKKQDGLSGSVRS